MLQILSALCLNPDLCGIYSSETGGWFLDYMPLSLSFFSSSPSILNSSFWCECVSFGGTRDLPAGYLPIHV